MVSHTLNHRPLHCVCLSVRVCVRPTECSDSKIDLVFLVDGSGSICDNDSGGTRNDPKNNGKLTCDSWELVKQFMIEFVAKLNVGLQDTRVGLATFANNANVVFKLTEYELYKHLLLSAVLFINLVNMYNIRYLKIILSSFLKRNVIYTFLCADVSNKKIII